MPTTPTIGSIQLCGTPNPPYQPTQVMFPPFIPSLTFQDEWIPVTERLPDNADDVQCYAPDWGQFTGSYHKCDGWSLYHKFSRHANVKASLSHWKPLPPNPTA